MARWQPPQEQVVEASKPSRWPLVVLLLAFLGVAAAGLWMLRRRMRPPLSDPSPTATAVRSDIAGAGDSLDVVVTWRLTEGSTMGVADSVRVEVGLDNGREAHDRVSPATRRTDTLRLRAPAPGETAVGYSCVAPVYGSRLSRESCTPWQYARPSSAPPPPPAAPDTTADRSRVTTPSAAATAPPTIIRIVVVPDGQQVDPDVDGKCAAWQRRFPGRSVWVEVNRQAVPDCTGPNGKPTVAQFCAFAVLADGRRVKLENSANNPYCEQLFQAWARQRAS